jgi:hypothetical protein
MKHWELAPTNPAAFEKAGISFSISTSDMRDSKQFLANLRKAVQYGLSETKALEALTKTPAQQIGVYDQVGSLEVGKLANFLITTEPIFNSSAKIIENWIQGNKYDVNGSEWNNLAGKYKLTINNAGTKTDYMVEIKKDLSASIIGTDTLAAKIAVSETLVKISFPEKKGRGVESIRLSGVMASGGWNGFGTDTKGGKLTWSASLVTPAVAVVEEKKAAEPVKLISKVTYPFVGLGNEVMPQQETILIKNATVLTNEKKALYKIQMCY